MSHAMPQVSMPMLQEGMVGKKKEGGMVKCLQNGRNGVLPKMPTSCQPVMCA